MRYGIPVIIPLLALLATCGGDGGYDRENQELLEAIPRYPGSTLVARTRFTESFPVTSRALVQVYATIESPPKVLAFFREELAGLGWQVEPTAKDELMAVFTRSRGEIEINSVSGILNQNFVGADDVERVADAPSSASTVFSVSANARASTGHQSPQLPQR